MTAARSVSPSAFHAGIAPLLAPFSTMWICLTLSSDSTMAEPSSALIGPAPLPSGLWQTAQLAIDLLATGQQRGHFPDLARIIGLGGDFLLLAIDPLGVVLGGHHLDV